MRGEGTPPYELGSPLSGHRYARYESGRDLNYYEADPNLRFVLEGHLDPAVLPWAEPLLSQLGERCGTVIVHRADTVDRVGHDLVRYDRFGHEISEIAYHPDWLANLNEVFDFGVVGWNHDDGRLACYGRAAVPLLVAFDYLIGQADMALCCPVELAHGGVWVLERFAGPELRRRLLPVVTATDAASRLQVAQVLTEITGGSDVGSTRTEARLVDGTWRLRGEKWFASNIGADLIFTLARVLPGATGTKGLGMFIVPRHRGDGTRNAIRIRRLKDKMGTIGVPTGELIFDDAEAHVVGNPEDGFRYMADMLNHTRFWNAVGALGVMRRAYLEAAVYAARRRAFGRSLDAFPMIREELVRLTVELEATTALVFEAAAALEAHRTSGDPMAYLRFRTLAPVAKYRAGEQNVEFARAAIEMLGGNGYVADFGTPRLLRDAQVNTIWEGTSNMCVLDLWRAIARQRGHEALLGRAEELARAVRTPPAARLADATLRGVKDVRTAVAVLEAASEARRQQQARRLADLVGDVTALAALTREADRAASAGDCRKALLGEVFAIRLAEPHSRFTAVTEGFAGIAELYEPLVAAGGCSEDEYGAALRRLTE